MIMQRTVQDLFFPAYPVNLPGENSAAGDDDAFEDVVHVYTGTQFHPWDCINYFVIF